MTPAATPTVARTREELARAREELRREGASLALVPTMGALHEGHRSLIRTARGLAGEVAVSIFVNPLQFGPGEDFERYPRAFEADLAACAEDGVRLVFAPTQDVLYPQQPRVRVSAGELGEVFEGASRPGHFDGVLTVVMKLFHLVGPDVAVFGEKDAQQLAAIRLMAADLDLPVRVTSGATVREPDGLALSSRNRYLSGPERATALALARGLRAGETAAPGGPAAVLRAARDVLDGAAASDPPLLLDYLTLVEPTTFTEVGDSAGFTGTAVLAVAGRVGSTRLIDNVRIVF